MESTRNKLVRVKISSIVLYDEVIKEFDLKLFEKLKRCIKKRGQLKNIIICETENGFECLEGSKIVKALQEIGEDSVIAYNLGVLSDEDKKTIRIELFRDFFLTNYVYIGKLLKEITETAKLDEICNTIPFDLRQAKHLINMHNFDWDSFNNDKQNEGQSSLFDIFEEDNLTEIVEKETEDLQKNDIAIEFVIEKELHEISEVKNENLVEKQSDEEIEDKVFNDLIDGVKPTEKPIVNENKDVKEFEALVNKKGEIINVGDKVFLQTPKKGLFEVEITKHSANWVYFIELSTGAKKDIDKKRFFENSTLSTPIELNEVKEVQTQVEEIENEKDEIDNTDENAKQELEDFFSVANVEEKKQLIKTDSFYYDYENKELVLIKNKGVILQNIPLIAKKILYEKWNQTCEPEKIDITIKDEVEQVLVTHVTYITEYHVTIRVILEEIGEVLMKIDFE